ncbi:hypothetical protein C8Q69DRAFT_470370 [Paecilomyces variotii]|uniref:Uncharacterized protein n=1 Tax=Byssochlamys spectabilis TaxID=264951 RepID=A0A443HRP5_BYSSP|nr:hypothetical protein C8Q69DRAFT_470370 [Paecilomyces variotii]KAJ9365537.1 hypothetical protein DTO280E4_506 [Paecilomyces variotii]RWQ94493.1 hypothetical protein C8Q69DRAFT_470370 [Paecilomyces variotii]
MTEQQIVTHKTFIHNHFFNTTIIIDSSHHHHHIQDSIPSELATIYTDLESAQRDLTDACDDLQRNAVPRHLRQAQIDLAQAQRDIRYSQQVMSRFSRGNIDYSRPLCAGCGKMHRGSCRAYCSRCRVSGHSRVYCPGGTTGGVVNVSGTVGSYYGRGEQRRDRKKKRRNRRGKCKDDAVEVKQEGGKVDREVVEIKKEVKE